MGMFSKSILTQLFGFRVCCRDELRVAAVKKGGCKGGCKVDAGNNTRVEAEQMHWWLQGFAARVTAGVDLG